MVYKDGLLAVDGGLIEVTPSNVSSKVAGHDIGQIQSATEQARIDSPTDHLGRVRRERLGDGLMILRQYLEGRVS
jgi:hypothetical protein